MHPTFLRQMPSLAGSIRNLLPKELPPSLSTPKHSNLYEVLSRLPRDLKGMKIHQTRWSKKNESAYWRITHARFKCEGKHGKAWGVLYREGKMISRRPEVIRQALKYDWAEGPSLGKSVAAKQMKPKVKPMSAPTKV